MVTLTRRHLLLCSSATLAAACAPVPAATAPPPPSNLPPKTQPDADAPEASESDKSSLNVQALVDLETEIGGRVGVYAIDTATGRSIAHREDERFAMASTFKWMLAAAILARVDRGELRLDEAVPYGEKDLLEYAPTTRARVKEGSMTLGALAEAAVTLSDNTAANLLLARVDGPEGLTKFLRAVGDVTTRLDRNEPELNTNLADDPRDTTSPKAMALTMQTLCTGDTLTAPRRDTLVGWLVATTTGKKRLRAGLPKDWRTGDKTGTGNRGGANDVAITWPPDRAPIVIASYLSGSTAEIDVLNAAHAEIARIVVQHLQ